MMSFILISRNASSSDFGGSKKIFDRLLYLIVIFEKRLSLEYERCTKIMYDVRCLA